jgi:hypothetical protein
VLYTSPIDTITWKDVEDFCVEGIAENAYVDYKRDFPTDLAKTVAAMANTHGGLVLIGVDELPDGKPRTPIAGIEAEPRLADRVTNIVLANVTPPLFPEIAVCPNESGEKVVLVLRIAQSNQTPHAIRSNTRVYFRTGNRANPEDLVDLNRLAWLLDKRARSIALREHLFDVALGRSAFTLGTFVRFVGNEKHTGGAPPNLVLRIIPHFPSLPFKTPPELRAVLRDIKIRDYFHTEYEFPPGTLNATLLQNAIQVIRSEAGDQGLTHSYYTELGVFGQYFYRQTLAHIVGATVLIRASEIFARTDEFLNSARKFYAAIGYQGIVLFKCSLFEADALPLGQWRSSEYADSHLSMCPDRSVGYESDFLVSDWDAESKRVLLESLQTVGWAFNYEVTQPLLDNFFQKHKA